MNNLKFSQYTPDYISRVMSLRKPQKDSLKILDSIFGDIELNKSLNKEELKNKIHDMYPIFTDFDRSFPSLTFALATGVGKTRLMGTFIAYLYTNKDIKNFLVVAPSLTIYNKLLNDLSNSSSSKYVFNGLGCFSFLPNIVSGEDYRNVNFNHSMSDINIFIYNAQKFNSDDDSRRANAINENLGTSFMNYLSSLPDLVVLMDESHHYRNNSTSEALDRINPVLGIELTATPQVVVGKKVIPFNNVVKDYPLALSIKDGYTRTPFALTRKNIDQYKWGDEKLDIIMVNDGLHWHEHMKDKLIAYAKENHLKVIKPFMLVVCQNIDHAKTILKYIKSNDCYGGKYKDKVIEIDSENGNEESSENIQLLLSVEDSSNPIEIIVHVNMLKEGWDVNNLYTIVPLRSAYSRTLVEQTIGRGLRLPYGKRTGDNEVDSVTMTAHSNFEKIISDAKKGDSIFKQEHIIDISEIDNKTEKTIQTKLDLNTEKSEINEKVLDEVLKDVPEEKRTDEMESLIKKIGEVVKDAVHENKENGKLTNEKFIKEKVEEKLIDMKDISDEVVDNSLDSHFLERIFNSYKDKYINIVKNNTIAIPRIIKKSQGEDIYYFEDFDLDLSSFAFVPVSQEIIRANILSPKDKYFESVYEIDFTKVEPARVILTILRDYAEIDYESCSELIVKLISTYLSSLKEIYTDNQIKNLVYSNKGKIADEIYAQMMRHYKVKSSGMIEVVSNISYEIKSPSYELNAINSAMDLYDDVPDGLNIKGLLFKGGEKWLTEYYKFDSGSEKMFAICCENNKDVIHWLRPTSNQFDLQYKFEGQLHNYEPDFVVETEDFCYLVEIKSSAELNNPKVLAKKQRGIEYCRIAKDWCLANGYKPWKYMFIPHDKVSTTNEFKFYENYFIVE